MRTEWENLTAALIDARKYTPSKAIYWFCANKQTDIDQTGWMPSLVRATCISVQIWTSMRENLSLGLANIKGANQVAYPCSLINAFVIHLLKSNKLASSEICF